MNASQILAGLGFTGSSVVHNDDKRVCVKVWTSKGWAYEKFEKAQLEQEITDWSRTVEPLLPEDRYGGMFAENGYAGTKTDEIARQQREAPGGPVAERPITASTHRTRSFRGPPSHAHFEVR